ncbi:MAG: HIT domain-containing protein [Chloroflexota bacterium]
MRRIWSPWRMEYIAGERKAGCVFCDTSQQDHDPDNLILLRAEHCFVMLNRYPYNNGHLMVVPFVHVDSPAHLPPAALLEMMNLVNICLEVLGEAMHPEGFNVGMNLGTPAGAGIADHMHMHVVPRWTGDTNFMPVLGETRVIVEALEASYRKLRPLFDCRCDALLRPRTTAEDAEAGRA